MGDTREGKEEPRERSQPRPGGQDRGVWWSPDLRGQSVDVSGDDEVPVDRKSVV